jgi:hypothetical protein
MWLEYSLDFPMNAITTQEREEIEVRQDAVQYILGRGAAGAYKLDLHPMISLPIIVQGKDI